MDCCETHGCGTAGEVLLTLVTGVGSLLTAALGPKTWPVWSYYKDEAIALPDFLDHPVKESHRG